MLLAEPARAEGWVYEGFLGIGTGLEGGDAGEAGLAWQRARFRLIGGVDFRSDEMPKDGLGVRGVVEIERRATFGGELRYSRWIGRGFGAFAGLNGTFAPETLLGGTAGVTAIIPLGRAGLYIEPSFSALPLGSDLPDDSVLLWALLSVGINVRL
ncbi:MAG TPA: hypothetical protein VGK73_21840 [Polyangiaceae bacterium]